MKPAPAPDIRDLATAAPGTVSFQFEKEGAEPLSVVSPKATLSSSYKKANDLVHAQVREAISEHANLIAGMALAKFERNGLLIQLVTPEEMRQVPRYQQDKNLHRVLQRAGPELTQKLHYRFVRYEGFRETRRGGGSIFKHYEYSQGRLLLWFNEVWIDLLSAKAHYTALELRHLAPLRTFYAQRLFEMLASHADTSGAITHHHLSHQELRNALVGFESKRFIEPTDFRRYALHPSVEDINHGGELRILDVKPRHQGRDIEGYHFKFQRRIRAAHEPPAIAPAIQVLADYIASAGYSDVEALLAVSRSHPTTVIDAICHYELATRQRDTHADLSLLALLKAGAQGRLALDQDHQAQAHREELGRRLGARLWAPLDAAQRLAHLEAFERDQGAGELNDVRSYWLGRDESPAAVPDDRADPIGAFAGWLFDQELARAGAAARTG